MLGSDMFVYISLALFTIVVIKFFQKRSEPATFGIYQKPGRWYFLKLSLIFLILKTRKIIGQWQSQQKKVQNSSNAGYGLKSRATPEDMDKQQLLSDHPKAIDAVYFNAASHDGYHLVVGTAHRPHGIVNGFMYLRVPDIGVLMTPRLPDTITFRTEEDGAYYGAEGIQLKPLKPMKSWEIIYNGKMNFHQTHYEQHGYFKGQVVINGNKYPLFLDGARDHSYGYKREWSLFHRYALHLITLENGSRMNVTIVCVPMVFSRMEMGYIYKPDGTLLPVQWCDLKLEKHGENGKPPLDYSFFFQAGGEKYHVQVDVIESPEFFMGWEWEARVVEHLARFTVNGIPGWGAAEWEYRHLSGRPGEVAANDPSFTHHICKG